MDLAVISHHDLWVGRITRAVVGRLSSDLQRVPCPCGAIVSLDHGLHGIGLVLVIRHSQEVTTLIDTGFRCAIPFDHSVPLCRNHIFRRGGPDELRGECDLGIIRLAVILITHTVTVAIETTELIDGGGSRLVWTNVGVIIEAI